MSVMGTPEANGYEVVEAVMRIAAIIREERARVGSDGTAFAGHLAGALRAAGGRLPIDSPYILRWPVNETPKPAADPTGYHAALALVNAVSTCLRRGDGPDQTLDDFAAVAPACASQAEAQAKMLARGKERADREADRVRQEHDKRLAAKPIPRAAPPAPKVLQRHPAANELPEGESAYGDGEEGYMRGMQGVQ
jgi:hypothetical protein